MEPDHFPDPIPEDAEEFVTCPRCDRKFYATTERSAMERLELHVQGQHPDHDPDWNKDV